MIKRDNPLRVLLADDETHMRKFVGETLSVLINCTVTTVSDGAAAISHCRTSDPDLIILDINMPRVDGMKALPEIRALKPTTPIIMLTSIVDEVIVEECVRKGASFYIWKDPLGNHLKSELETMLRDFVPEKTNHEQTGTNPS